MSSVAVMGKQRARLKPPASERSFEIRVVHRDRPNLTALTELFVRFTLAEAHARRDTQPDPMRVRPEVLKQDADWERTGEGR